MENIVIKATERSEKPKKVRSAGFIPGVLNGPGTASADVQFENVALNKIITKHGTNAKLWVVLGDKKSFGFIKEVQKHPVEGKVMHVAIQLVSKDQDIKMQLPILFNGHAALENKSLQMQICKAEVEVAGKAECMPDEVTVDVSKKESGENITAVDFHLPSGIKILNPENEIYAVIKTAPKVAAEEPEDPAPATV